jgi:threonylcarbamoyladenosine tRNA methylthiotransferase CDKAL1
MNKVFVCTAFKLCDNNGYLTTRLSNFFTENGVEVVRDPEDADTVVITTCGFDQTREDESAELVNHYLRKYDGAKEIIVSGCLTSIHPEALSPKLTLIGNKELQRFDDRFGATRKMETISGSALSDEYISREYGFIDAYYIQICQGCVSDCSYCAIKRAKGYVESKPIEKIIGDIERGRGLGFRRFMLLGDDCGSYGADLGVDLAQLLNTLTAFDIRILINYIEPGKFLSLYPRIEPSAFEMMDFVNVPVQATSRRVIGLMNRRYDPERVMETVREIKSKFPALYLETHVIFGFPGETREEFRATLRLAEVFDAVIYFCYTDRKNVRSATLPGKVAGEELRQRIEEIVAHTRFTRSQQGAAPPIVLLGYGPETTRLLETLPSPDGPKASKHGG